MRLLTAIRFVGGSLVVYASVAACSAAARMAGPDLPVDAGALLEAMADALGAPPEARADESGTRLKARRLVAEDGARQFVGWRDAKRLEDCSFRLASDGMMRCLPDAVGVPTYYSDAACTRPLASPAAGGCAIPAYMVAFKLACGGASTTRLYPVTGAPYTGAAFALFGAADCQPEPGIHGLGATGPEVAPGEFVAATTAADP